MLHLSEADIESLTLSSHAKNFKDLPGLVKNGSKRRIFSEVELEPQEIQAIKELKDELKSQGVIINDASFDDRELLRHLYAQNFEKKVAIDDIKKALAWKSEYSQTLPTHGAIDLLHTGAVYTLGRDNQCRPILILNLSKINWSNVEKRDLCIVLYFMLDSLKNYSFLPGKVENLVLVIDADQSEPPRTLAEAADYVFERVFACFPCIIEKMYIINPSEKLTSDWSFLKGLFAEEALAKISTVKSQKMLQLQSGIDSSQLETKYGGSISDLKIYWPLSSGKSMNNSYLMYTRSTYPQYSFSTTSYHFDRPSLSTMTHSSTDDLKPKMSINKPEENSAKEERISFIERIAQKNLEDDETHDLNDEDFIDILAKEHASMKGEKPSVSAVVPSVDHHQPSNQDHRYEISQILTRVKTLNLTLNHPHVSSPLTAHTQSTDLQSPSDYHASSAQNSHVESVKKSSFTPREEPSKIPEWTRKQLIQSHRESEDSDDDEHADFCGLFLSKKASSKKTAKKVQKA